MTSTIQTIKASFHGIEYVVNWNCSQTNLSVTVEDDIEGQFWTATFDSHYIEDVTHKTGNFKRFGVFSQMLTTALRSPTPRLFADLLTLQDLELLRTRMSTGTSTSKSLSASTGSLSNRNGKRYLIVTYLTEFDRIHYPLPLPYCENPSTEMLHRTINRLRDQVQRTNSSDKYPELGVGLDTERSQIIRDLEDATKQIRELGQENKELRQELDNTRRSAKLSRRGKNEPLEADRKKLEARLERVLKDFKRERSGWNQERSQWEVKLSEYQEQLEHFDEENVRLRQHVKVLQSSAPGGSKATVTRLQRSLKEERATQDLLRQRISKLQTSHRRQTDQLKADLRTIREANVSLRKKLRDSTAPAARRRVPGRSPARQAPQHRSTRREPLDRRNSPARGARRSPSPATFDPTEYQRKQEERRQRIKERNERMVRSRQRQASESPHRGSRSSAPFRSSPLRSSQTSAASRRSTARVRKTRPARGRSPVHTSRRSARSNSSMSGSQASLASRESARMNRDRPWRSSSRTKRSKPKRKPSKLHRERSASPVSRGSFASDVLATDFGYQSGGSTASLRSQGSRSSRQGGTGRANEPRKKLTSRELDDEHDHKFEEIKAMKRTRAKNAKRASWLEDPAVEDSDIVGETRRSAADLIEQKPVHLSVEPQFGSSPDIQDIDDRLSKLSSFLKAAKESVSKLSETPVEDEE